MNKKRKTKKQPRQSDQPRPLPPDGPVFDDLMELVRQGYVTMASTGTDDDALMDAVFVPVTKEMRVPPSVDPETRLAEDRLLIEQGTIPERLHKELRNDATALWRHFQRMKLKPWIEAVTGKRFIEVWQSISQHDPNGLGSEFASEMMLAGFDAALDRYAHQLKDVPELAAWRKERKQGGDNGRKTQASTKDDKARKAQAMFAQGAGIADIAREIGRSVPTVYRLLKKDAGGKPAKRQRPPRR